MEIKKEYIVIMNNDDTYGYLYNDFNEAKATFDGLVKIALMTDLYYAVKLKWKDGEINYCKNIDLFGKVYDIIPYSEEAWKRH